MKKYPIEKVIKGLLTDMPCILEYLLLQDKYFVGIEQHLLFTEYKMKSPAYKKRKVKTFQPPRIIIFHKSPAFIFWDIPQDFGWAYMDGKCTDSGMLQIMRERSLHLTSFDSSIFPSGILHNRKIKITKSNRLDVIANLHKIVNTYRIDLVGKKVTKIRDFTVLGVDRHNVYEDTEYHSDIPIKEFIKEWI